MHQIKSGTSKLYIKIASGSIANGEKQAVRLIREQAVQSDKKQAVQLIRKQAVQTDQKASCTIHTR